jgi:hypothetical protein
MKNKYQLDEMILTKLEKSARSNVYDFKVQIGINGELEDLPGMFSFYDEKDLISFADMLEMDLRELT